MTSYYLFSCDVMHLRIFTFKPTRENWRMQVCWKALFSQVGENWRLLACWRLLPSPEQTAVLCGKKLSHNSRPSCPQTSADDVVMVAVRQEIISHTVHSVLHIASSAKASSKQQTANSKQQQAGKSFN